MRPAAARHDLVHFGFKKRFAAHTLGLAATALRLKNLHKRARVPERILILEPFGLGDIISFEPLVRILKERRYHIALCGKPEWKALYPEDDQLKWIDARLPWSAHNQTKKYVLKDYTSVEFRSCLRELADWGKAATGLDTRGDIRSVAVLRLAGCRRVLALENYLGSNLTITSGAAERIPFEHNLRRWELNLSFLKALEPDRAIGPVSGPFFPHLAKRQIASEKGIGLVPVAPWAGKLWNPEKWQSLVKTLRERKVPISGLCGPAQKELAEEQLQRSLAVIECGSLESWAEVFNSCSVVISLDSGPMHLADALGIPTVALFGQGKLPLWAPSNPRSIAISHQDDPGFVLCQPVDENTDSGKELMSRITVAEVLAAVEKILE